MSFWGDEKGANLDCGDECTTLLDTPKSLNHILSMGDFYSM